MDLTHFASESIPAQRLSIAQTSFFSENLILLLSSRYAHILLLHYYIDYTQFPGFEPGWTYRKHLVPQLSFSPTNHTHSLLRCCVTPAPSVFDDPLLRYLPLTLLYSFFAS